MTDLTTMHLKCLLEKATPGPWDYEGPKFQEITTQDNDGLEQAVISLDRYTEKETCNRPDDFTLAAAAPDLAQEVIRLREELMDWANDEARAHNALVKRAQEAGGAGIVSTHKTIYNRIWEILGAPATWNAFSLRNEKTSSTCNGSTRVPQPAAFTTTTPAGTKRYTGYGRNER